MNPRHRLARFSYNAIYIEIAFEGMQIIASPVPQSLPRTPLVASSSSSSSSSTSSSSRSACPCPNHGPRCGDVYASSRSPIINEIPHPPRRLPPPLQPAPPAPRSAIYPPPPRMSHHETHHTHSSRHGPAHEQVHPNHQVGVVYHRYGDEAEYGRLGARGGELGGEVG